MGEINEALATDNYETLTIGGYLDARIGLMKTWSKFALYSEGSLVSPIIVDGEVIEEAASIFSYGRRG